LTLNLCVRYSLYTSGSGSGNVNKHGHGDRGCSNKKVDFEKNMLYDLGDCEGSVIEKVHGKV
jgi:hypothetical protein